MFRVERPVVLQPGLRPGPVETMTRYRVGPVLLVGPPGPGYALVPDPDHPGLYILSDDGGPLPAGGLAGQVLGKASDADTDYAWADVAAGGGVGEVRHAHTGVLDYVGVAADGTSETAAGWRITRITVATSGAATVARCMNGTWTNRGNEAYT